MPSLGTFSPARGYYYCTARSGAKVVTPWNCMSGRDNLCPEHGPPGLPIVAEPEAPRHPGKLVLYSLFPKRHSSKQALWKSGLGRIRSLRGSAREEGARKRGTPLSQLYTCTQKLKILVCICKASRPRQIKSSNNRPLSHWPSQLQVGTWARVCLWSSGGEGSMPLLERWQATGCRESPLARSDKNPAK